MLLRGYNMTSIIEKISSISKNRILTGVLYSNNTQCVELKLPENEKQSKERLTAFLESLLSYGGGVVTVRIDTDNEHSDVSALCIKSSGEWFPVPKDNLIKAYTTCSECGEETPIPENITVKDFNSI